MTQDINEVRRRLLAKKEGTKELKGISTGSTLLNLACTGNPDIGLYQGNYYYLVGDSSSGKSFLSLTCLAEASLNPDFQDYRFIFDNAENGALMNIRKFFGKSVEEKLEPPAGTRDKAIYSATVEEFYWNVDEAFKAKKPFIYILDSMDALSTEDEEEKFQSDKRAHAKGKEEGGSYGTDKAKKNSSRMRIVFNRLRKEGKSILIVISQTRSNIGFGSQFNPKTRSGGKALTFYAALEVWSSVKSHVKIKERGHWIEQGIICQVRTKKNRLSGKDRTVEFPILHSKGIDDIGGCVSYLAEWKHWKHSKEKTGELKSIEAPEFEFSGSPEDLINKIQNENKENELKKLVASVWAEIEKATEPQRKSRYV